MPGDFGAGFRMPGFLPRVQGASRFQYTTQIMISLASTLQNQQQKVTVHAQKPCVKCKTTGKTGTHRCTSCLGNGCKDCGGLGAGFDICDDCKGAGFKMEPTEVTIHIPRGIPQNAKVTTPIPNGSGTVVTEVTLNIPQGMQVGGEGKLLQDIFVPYSTAVLGGSHTLTTLEGTQIAIRIPPLKNGQMVKIKGKGVCLGPHTEERGDLVLIPRIDIPEELTPEHKTIIEELARITNKE